MPGVTPAPPPQRFGLLAKQYGAAKERVLLPFEIDALQVGSRVKVFWPAEKESFDGVIAQRNTDETFVVHYDDDEQQAYDQNLSVDEYRAKALRELHRAVDSTSFVAVGKAMIDAEGFKREWKQLEPILHEMKLKASATRNEPSTRDVTRNLLRDLPKSFYPNTRKLLITMLVLPASSAQSERDFSAQNRIKVKGRASLGSSEDGPRMLDQFMRIYSVPRSMLFTELDGLENGLDGRPAAMRKDPATYILQPDLPRGRPGRALPITLAAWSLWKKARSS